jgi:hypothetical protein
MNNTGLATDPTAIPRSYLGVHNGQAEFGAANASKGVFADGGTALSEVVTPATTLMVARAR